MAALAPEVRLDGAVRRAARSGAAFVPGALDAGFRARLLAEIDSAAFHPMPDEVGRYAVRQHGEQLFVAGAELANWPGVNGLRAELVAALHDQAAAIEGIAAWWPNEAAVQRYPPGAGTIGVHRDGKRYASLVVICTVEGAAPLAVCADRAGTTLWQWDAVAGSIILLRGPGLAGVPDGRPLHRVDPPQRTRRTSLTFRMDTTR